MSIFSIGVSGLNTAQLVLSTTSNNITNVYTPGYNRQIALVDEGLVNNGVQVGGIQRQFSQFVAGQLNQASSASSALDAYNVQVGQIDSLLADREAGLAPLLQNFFSSLQDLAATPSDPASRQGVIGSADTLTAQFRAFDGYLEDMQQGIGGQIEDEVFQINNLAEQIAMLNREISLAKAKTGEAPNSLLNQRDHLVADLSKRLDVKLTIQDGGSYNLGIGNGQALVAGVNSFKLVAMPSSADPTRTVVGYSGAAGDPLEFHENTFSGGTLGGLMTFRRETLDKTQNQIGQIAVSLAQGFNEQHAQGVDLSGTPGENFFSIGQPRAYANANNNGVVQIADTAFGELDDLLAVDYTVRVTDASAPAFEVVRKDNGAVLEPDQVSYSDSDYVLSFGGVSLTFDGDSFADGDSYEVQPVRRASAGLQNDIRDTAKIAAGLNPDLTDDPDDSTGAGDNRNALALQNLQSKALVGGNSTLSQSYAAMVGDVGNRTNVVKANLAAQQSLTEQLSALQQSESGVNLDEEAANLLRFQQYYQANAKIIEVGTTIIDTLLGLPT